MRCETRFGSIRLLTIKSVHECSLKASWSTILSSCIYASVTRRYSAWIGPLAQESINKWRRAEKSAVLPTPTHLYHLPAHHPLLPVLDLHPRLDPSL